MSDVAIGFLGFGEAGFHIAKGLQSTGATKLFAFDIDTGERVRKRADEAGIPLLASNAALAESSEIIFSVVTANQAANAARATAPHLSSRHL